jgi:nitrogen fixation-related uncharacterized protein
MMDYLSLVFGVVILLVLLWALLRVGLLEKPDYDDDDGRADRIIEASKPAPLSESEIADREYMRRPHVRALTEAKDAEDRWTRVL